MNILTAPKTQMTNMLMKKEIARAMVDSMELYLIPSFISTGSLLEMARLYSKARDECTVMTSGIASPHKEVVS